MARTRQNRMPSRKRKFNGGSRFAKKRKFAKRRRTSSTTTKSGFARTVGAFTAKKTSRSKYKNMLWTSTAMSTHFRSVYGVSFVLNTNAAANVANVGVIPALHPDANLFWTGAGGAIASSPGVAVPTSFADNIVIRGGTIGLTLANDVADSTSQKIKVFLIKTGAEYATGALPTAVQVGWDPTCTPDFNNDIGHIIMSKEILLENVNSAEVAFRIPIHKIEQNVFFANQKTYVWFITTNSPSGTASTLTATAWFNLSFAGDIIA